MYVHHRHTRLPGLIDALLHAPPQCLRFGVTTVCDMHNAARAPPDGDRRTLRRRQDDELRRHDTPEVREEI
ncbi:hypothetical protein EJ03DRAFT_4600 [Teratosphaeria nubilosa]|uniref:Uncharacterized protein n=1 Tax=Teratosphaeria nubilosa TaxID=161662 RepID=A0A6G1LN34_9PEZI|nr:hypothetical protein EJ03DRAFT_4600 [Teratosphaeria nubilosa]